MKIDFKAGSGGFEISVISFVAALFIVLKEAGQVTWPWVWVLVPLWGPIVMVVIVVLVRVIFVKPKPWKDSAERYYVCDLYGSNAHAPMVWMKQEHGTTQDLERAGMFTQSELKRFERPGLFAYPVDEVHEVAQWHVVGKRPKGSISIYSGRRANI